MNVAFDPFHTPQAPSLCQSCAITSNTESGVRMASWWAGTALFGARGGCGDGCLWLLGRLSVGEGARG
jgi:hypothetical protein